MFKFHPTVAQPQVTLRVDGQPLRVPAGISVAAALLGGGVLTVRRTPVTGTPRGPWCLMGACFDCLVTIDGVRDLQACLTIVRDNMCIELPMIERGAQSDDEPDPWGAGP